MTALEARFEAAIDSRQAKDERPEHAGNEAQANGIDRATGVDRAQPGDSPGIDDASRADERLRPVDAQRETKDKQTEKRPELRGLIYGFSTASAGFGLSELAQYVPALEHASSFTEHLIGWGMSPVPGAILSTVGALVTTWGLSEIFKRKDK